MQGNTSMTDPVSRSEFELFVKTYEIQRQELRLETKEFETDIKANINALTNKIDALSNQVNRRSLDVWKVLASSTLTLISGYVLGLLQHLLIH